MEINHEKENQQFSISLEGEEAELAYALPEEGVITFTHTFVPEFARGKGIADQLIKHGLDYAEKNNLKVIAQCQAVQVYIKRHPDYERLL